MIADIATLAQSIRDDDTIRAVVRGTAIATVTETGMSTELGRIAGTDTDPERVARRIGILPPKATLDEAHDLFLGLLEPEAFLAQAELSETIHPLTDRVLDRTPALSARPGP